MASTPKSKRILPKADTYAPQRDPPSSEEIADSLVDAFIKIATDRVADEEWNEGYQAGLADGKYEAEHKDRIDRFVDFILPFSLGFATLVAGLAVTHALHWWS